MSAGFSVASAIALSCAPPLLFEAADATTDGATDGSAGDALGADGSVGSDAATPACLGRPLSGAYTYALSPVGSTALSIFKIDGGIREAQTIGPDLLGGILYDEAGPGWTLELVFTAAAAPNPDARRILFHFSPGSTGVVLDSRTELAGCLVKSYTCKTVENTFLSCTLDSGIVQCEGDLTGTDGCAPTALNALLNLQGRHAFNGVEGVVVNGVAIPAYHYYDNSSLLGNYPGTEQTEWWLAIDTGLLLRAKISSTFSGVFTGTMARGVFTQPNIDFSLVSTTPATLDGG